MSKFERVKFPDDPNRCQATHANFQCPFRAEGTYDPVTKTWNGRPYCARHGANSQVRVQAENIRMYRIAQWQAQIDSMEDHPKLKTIRSEIGVLRILLQNQLDVCRDQQQLLLHSGRLLEIIRELNKAVPACAKLEEQLGQVLDKTQATQFIQEIIATITMYIDDEMILQLIANDMTASLEKILQQKPNIYNPEYQAKQ